MLLKLQKGNSKKESIKPVNPPLTKKELTERRRAGMKPETKEETPDPLRKVTDLEYLGEALKYIQIRINQIKHEIKQKDLQVQAAEIDKKHIISLMKKIHLLEIKEKDKKK